MWLPFNGELIVASPRKDAMSTSDPTACCLIIHYLPSAYLNEEALAFMGLLWCETIGGITMRCDKIAGLVGHG
jgi:hypothetical protein